MGRNRGERRWRGVAACHDFLRGWASIGEAGPTMRIARERRVAPGVVIKTVGLNAKFQAPILRMPEGKRVTVDVRNDTAMAELVHWNGQKTHSSPPKWMASMEKNSRWVPREAAAVHA